MLDARTEPSRAIAMGDIYYVLFKHKWKIVGFALVGLFAAAFTYRSWPDVVYRSDAKLFIRYIQESGAPLSVGEDAQIKSTDQRGETIITSEVEILTSMDLAKQVALNLGPERVLEAFGGGSDLDAAAAVIRGGLEAAAPRGSRVLGVKFQHPDRSITQPVLSTLIDEYLKRHLEIHMTTGMFDDLLQKETQSLRDHLQKTEEDLRRLKEKAGVLSLDEAKKAYAEQMAKTKQQILETTGLIAERKALLSDYDESQVPYSAVPAEKAQEYRAAVGTLETLTQKYQEMFATFTAESVTMADLRRRMARAAAVKEQLEEQFPALRAAAEGGTERMHSDSAVKPSEERARLRALNIRLQVLQDHLNQIQKEANDLSELELSISDLQRRKELQEAQYRYFSTTLEQTRINEALGSGRVSNITVIQSPTPPVRDVGKLYKVVGGLAAGGLIFGLALAFCLELFLDQSVRRPVEIESVLGLPLFFSIPNIPGRLGRGPLAVAQLEPPADLGRHRGAGVENKFASYFDALRDRLIFFFEMRGVVKKPKLVAVTSCGDRAGVSTVAAGLAASLSKTGDGNVLLVDMNMGPHTPYHFRDGKIQIGLDDLLEGQHRDEARVHEHLFVVPHATGTERLSRILPKRFSDMIPRLRASDYDYIIFDMPPVNQISVTPQLARNMDMVFLLVESEKTNRDAVKRASNLLSQASCTLSVIVNRTRNYLPRPLLQEI
jgi:Uncharacterized protein involved in exopolysaccharide biosynthesis